MRRIEDLKDDEIIDAVAAFGMNGIDTATPFTEDEDPCRRMAVRLGLLETDSYSEEEAEAEAEALVVEALVDSLTTIAKEEEKLEAVGETWIRITPVEWGRRLAGKAAEDIARLLRGTL